MWNDPVIADLDRYLDSVEDKASLTNYIDEHFNDLVDELLFIPSNFIEFLCDIDEEKLSLLREWYVEYKGEDFIRDLLADQYYEDEE